MGPCRCPLRARQGIARRLEGGALPSRPLHDRMHRIAAVQRRELEAHAGRLCLACQFGMKSSARPHVEPCQPSPAAGCRTSAAGVPGWPKSTMCSEPPGVSDCERRVDRRFPVGDHRQRIGDEDAVEALSGRTGQRVEIGGVALRQRRPVGEASRARSGCAPSRACPRRCRGRRSAHRDRAARQAPCCGRCRSRLPARVPPLERRVRAIRRSRPSR